MCNRCYRYNDREFYLIIAGLKGTFILPNSANEEDIDLPEKDVAIAVLITNWPCIPKSWVPS